MTFTETTLGEFFDVKHGYAFKSKFFTDAGPCIVVTPGNFYEKGGFRIRDGKEKFYVGEVPNGFLLNKDDLVVAMTQQGPGLLGSSALIPENDRFLHNQRIGLIVDLDESHLNKRFLFYLFNTRPVRGQIEGSSTGAKVKHTAPKRIKAVRIAIPPVEVQERIADILSAYDDLIENNRRRIALLEEAAQQLYKEWFVRLHFPGHENTIIIDGVPEGWTIQTLSYVASVNGNNLPSSFDGEIEYVDISAVSKGRIGKPTTYNYRDAPGRAKRIVRHGDIIWSCVRPNRRSHAIIWHPRPNLIVSTGFAVISSQSVSTSYLYQTVTSDAFVGYLENHAKGAAYPAVVAKDFEQAAILIPTTPVIASFNNAVEPMIELIHNLTTQNERLTEARDLLLPRLMSGEIEV